MRSCSAPWGTTSTTSFTSERCASTRTRPSARRSPAHSQSDLIRSAAHVPRSSFIYSNVTPMRPHDPTILAIDPGTRELGYAVLLGPHLIDSGVLVLRSEEHTSELQSRFGISYAVFCLKKKNH